MDLSDNELSEPSDCLVFVRHATCIIELDLRKNSVCDSPKFRDEVLPNKASAK